MKKTLSLILALIMVAAMFAVITVPASAADAAVVTDEWDGTADTTWYDATKTEFTLTTAEQLAGLAKIVDEADASTKPFLGMTVKLGADMILNKGTFTLADDKASALYNGAAVDEKAINVWEPIGVSYKGDNQCDVGTKSSFWGTFDGQGHTISGMYVNQAAQQQGFFAHFAGPALKNIKITNSYVCADSRAGSLVGFIDNLNTTDVVVENIWSDAIVVVKHTSTDVRSGGIVGISRKVNALTFKDLTFEGIISAISVANAEGTKPAARNYGGVIGVTVDDDKAGATYENIVNKGSMYADTVHADPQTGCIVGNHCYGNFTMKNITVDLKDTNMTLENGFAAEHVVDGKANLYGMTTAYSALVGVIEKADTVATYENCSWKHIGIFVTGIGETPDAATVNGMTGTEWKAYNGMTDIPGAANHVAKAESFSQAVPPTCTTPGTISYAACETCGVMVNKDLQTVSSLVDPAACTLGELVKGTPATCTEAGTVDHYKCSVCNKLYDADKKEITSIEIPAAHTLGEWVEAVEATTEKAGVLGHYQCSVCNKYFDKDEKELASIEGAPKLTTPVTTVADKPAGTTAEPEKKGCGGFTAVGALLALVALTGTAIVIKKK